MQSEGFERIVEELERFLGGVPRSAPTRRGARQWIGPNGNVVRFDLFVGQHGREGPHVNLETARLPRSHPDYLNRHVPMR